ncbi:MAG: SusC/RagA family TonB-linked outer membrane protein [Bacteroidales bacterium]|nr:SusC/RagA family TonB-linked outer membrane protein [Bacteroidales bacterium]MCF8389563.1 SusC/RagA family TonB-linked outer membrane protein [Bacteroidales bacterium]
MINTLIHIRPVFGNLLKNFKVPGLMHILLVIIMGFGFDSVLLGQVEVTGIVIDMETGTSLPGVNIVEKGTLNGSVTDLNGNYKITVSGSSSVLVFSFVGFISLEEPVGNKFVINASLSSGISLEEVLVVGYGTQKKESVVGAISQVEGDVLVSAGTNNVSTAISGKLSGVVTIQTEGKPGEEEPRIYIRGAATWNSTNPLIMVDGIERSSWSDLNPNEIESISVLKDASATAVYGAKGGNGVILITTKRGSSGKPVFNFSYTHTLKQVSDKLTMENAYETITRFNTALKNDNLWDQLYSQDEIEHYRLQDEPYLYPSVNWIDEMFKTGQSTSSNLSVKGGTKMLDYFVSLGYLYDGDIINVEKQGDFDPRNFYNRYNLRTNLDFKLSNSTTLSANLSGSMQIRNRPSEMNRGSHSLVWAGIYSSAVNASPLYYPASLLERYPDPNEPEAEGIRYAFFNNGHLHDNPYSMLNTVGFEKQEEGNLNTDLLLSQDLSSLIDGLSFKASLSYGSNSEYRRIYGGGSGNMILPRYRLTVYEDDSYLWQRKPDYYEDLPLFTFKEESQNFYIRNLYYDSRLNYDKVFAGDHYVTAMAIFRRKQINIVSQEPFREEAWSGRVTYAYKLKYLFETNLGYNGSESFAPGKRFGFFPAFAVGWNIAEEPFFKDNLSFIDRFKLRYSFGVVGVDNVSRWLYYQSYYEGRIADTDMIVNGNGLGAFGAWYSTNKGYFEGPIANTLAQWETALKQNLGIEIGISGSLNVSLDLFKEERDNILQTPNTVPEIASLEFKELNIGKTKSHGYEMEISYKNDLSSNLSLLLNSKLSFTENRVIFRDDPPGLPEHQRQEGFPIGMPRTYLSDGRYESVDDINNYVSPGTTSSAIGAEGYPTLYFYAIGDEKYIDYNSDGIIDANDAVADLYPAYPRYHLSFSGTLKYKAFSFRTLLTAQINKTSRLEAEFILPFTNTFPVLYEHEVDFYSSDNQLSFFPLPHTGVYGQYNYLNPIYSTPVSSFLRLKEIELSYALNFKKTSSIEKLHLFVSGNNILTFSPNTFFGDPEKPLLRPGLDGSYPLLRRYNLGIRLSIK